MVVERAVKNELADCEEIPALEISVCITPTTASQLATKSEEMGIHNILNNTMKSVPSILGKI